MKLCQLAFLGVSLGSGALFAQSVETKSGGAITLNQSSEMFSTHLTNGGTVTLNGTSRIALKGNLSNNGTYSSADATISEFLGSGSQTITSTNTLDFGRLKCNNTSSADLVSLHANADCFKIEVNDGHLRLCNDFTKVFSTDTASSDPMVAVKVTTTLTVDGCTLYLSGGKMFVFSGTPG
jgi:hypothetical protein